MKKVTVILLGFFMVSLLTGCYSVKVVAPINSNVKLLAATDNANFKESNKNWYVLCGLVPLKNKTDKVIAENGLTEVRIETKFTFVDYLITAVVGMATFGVNTTIVEGNRK